MGAELESERTKIELLRTQLAKKDIEASTCAGCLKSAEEDCVRLQAEIDDLRAQIKTQRVITEATSKKANQILNEPLLSEKI